MSFSFILFFIQPILFKLLLAWYLVECDKGKMQMCYVKLMNYDSRKNLSIYSDTILVRHLKMMWCSLIESNFLVKIITQKSHTPSTNS